MSKERSAHEGVNSQIEVLQNCEKENARCWSAFLDRIGRPELASVWTERRPMTYFSAEYMLPGLGANGGLGALSRDHFLQAVALEQPSLFFGLGYDLRKAQSVVGDGVNFYQQDPAEKLPAPGEIGMRLVEGVRVVVKKSDEDVELPVYEYSVGGSSTRLLLLPAPGEVYPAEVSSNARLWNNALLGFGGYRVLQELQKMGKVDEPAFIHLNESATVLGALAALDDMTTEQGGGEEGLRAALSNIRQKTILTNHTLVPAAEARFNRWQYENYIECNISSPELRDLLSRFISQRGEKLVLLELAMFLAGRYNGVSELHAQMAVDSFQKIYGKDFYGQPIEFGAVTNGIFLQGWNPEMSRLLMEFGVLDEFGVPVDMDLNANIESFPDEVIDAQKSLAVGRLREFLKNGERRDQFGQIIDLPEDAIVVGDARRVADYKRRWMMFKRPDELERILKENPRMHVFISGKAHPSDTVAKPQLEFVLRSIASRQIFRDRVHYLPEWDARLAQVLGPACSVWLNNPRVGEEACGTSGMKTGLGGALQVSTVDGFYAELERSSFNAIEGGTNSEEEFDSYYRELEKAVVTSANPKDRAVAVKKLWKGGLLRIASGARMLGDYAHLAFPN